MTRVFPRIFTTFSFLVLLSFPLGTTRAATITVTETTDAFNGSVCTLRNAIESVNNGGDFGGCDFDETEVFGTNDTINLTATEPYVLSLGETTFGGENNNVTGDLDIHTRVRIIGLGSGQTTISGSGFPADQEDRIIHIVEAEIIPEGTEPATGVLLQGMTIRDGNTENSGSGEGGGVGAEFFQARVTLDDVTVTENNCSGDGGGISNDDEGFFILQNSRVTANTATSDGGAINNNSGSFMVVLNSTLDGNSAPDDGGAIQNDGEMLIANSTISRNSCVEEGSPEIVISGTLSGDGGGIINRGGLIMINSTVSNNDAGFQGGGIFAESAAPAGGGSPFLLALFNVTVAENEVLSAQGFGGGVCLDCAQVVPAGNGIAFNVINTLIARNTAANSPDCGGDFISGGYNLIGDGTNCNGFNATGDQVGVADPGFGPLQPNGGPTETHALLATSPAVDRANDVDGCQAPDVDQVLNLGGITIVDLTEDQRAFTRPIAVLDPSVPICDIGAFEFQVATPTPTPTALPTPTPSPTPPANVFLFGGACSLHAMGGSSAGIGLMAFGLLAGMAGWRKRRGSD